ncbi:transposase, partial [Methylotenera sp.]|uniref:transposase n=1 Tax=Methylotenera sp. TaxID=2051956 RepID=UPI0027356E9A
MYQWQFQQLGVDGLTLDLDSTVMTRHGVQEGSARGYNPSKPGRVSHHPLMAFVVDICMIANCWLRPGNTASANNVGAFLDSTLTNLAGKRIGLLRADSSFSDNVFLYKLEAQNTSHIIALRLNQPLQRALVGAQGWWTIDDGIDLVSVQYQAPSWPHPRTVVGIRQHINKRVNPKGKTLSLFADDPTIGQYRFGALVTNTTLPAQEVWRTYRGRADCENR